MSTFKTALRMALAHPFYLLIYTVFISLMGVFIAAFGEAGTRRSSPSTSPTMPT